MASLSINVDLRFTTTQHSDETGGVIEKVLCFKHAVQRAMKNEDIEVEVDEFGDEYDMRSTSCDDCAEELD